MRVLLAGATGTIGTALLRQLLSADHEVIGLTRSERGAESLRQAGAESRVADVMDEPALRSALDGVRADAVIHQATAISTMPLRHRALYATNALRTQGTANLLTAAEFIGAQRFVAQSFLYGYGYRDHGNTPLTEEAPFGEEGRGGFNHHLSALRANEDQVLGSSAVAGMALRYGIFYGPEPATLGLFDQIERRRLPVPRRSGVVSLVHVQDAAAAAVAALERGRAGQAYNVADDEPVRWSDYLDEIARVAGAPPPRRVPTWMLRLAPYLGTMMVGTSLRLDTCKAKEQLDWRPRYPTIREGLAEVARGRRTTRG